jgi:hypothetical protein
MRAQSVVVFVIAFVAGCAIPIIGAQASGGSSALREAGDKPRAERRQGHKGKQAQRAQVAAAKPRPAKARAPEAPPAPPEPKALAVAEPKGAPRYALSTMRPAPRRGAPGTCYAKLDDAGVRYERVDSDKARGVQYPTRLQGPVGGVEIVQHDRRAPNHQAILDCRLALAVLTWAPSLRRAGVRRIEHYSMYRPGARVGGGGKKSGHSTGMALDAARFHLENGQVVDVLTD